MQASGRAKECVLVDLLQCRTEQDGGQYDEDTLKDFMATLYFGGFSSLLTMVLYSAGAQPVWKP